MLELDELTLESADEENPVDSPQNDTLEVEDEDALLADDVFIYIKCEFNMNKPVYPMKKCIWIPVYFLL